MAKSGSSDSNIAAGSISGESVGQCSGPNGAWLQATEIPAGKDRWTTRNEIGELTRQQVATLMDEADTAPVGSTARKVADFRAAYLNEGAIEARGLTPLQALLDSIDRVGDKAALTRLLGRGRQRDRPGPMPSRCGGAAAPGYRPRAACRA